MSHPLSGNYVQGKLVGHGLILDDRDACFDGEMQGDLITAGKGTMYLPEGYKIEGVFAGDWRDEAGLKVSSSYVHVDVALICFQINGVILHVPRKHVPLHTQLQLGVVDSRGDIARATDVNRPARIDPADKWTPIFQRSLDEVNLSVCW